VLAGWGSALRAEAAAAEIRTAFLFNFALYTSWPEPRDSFGLCVLGDDDLGESLAALERRAIGGRPLRVRRLGSAKANPEECDIVYVPPSAAGRLDTLLAPLAAAPVLTVVDLGKAAPRRPTGAILSLYVEGDRMRFDADLERAHRAGLRLSARLLRLASNLRESQ
jgi:hypothetical protein